MIIKPLDIKGVHLNNNIMLAPLAGVSDVGFRSVCRMFGASLSFTEMVSAKGLHYKNKSTAKLLFTDETEKPCGVQIFGSSPEIMAEACTNPMLSKFDIIDINMGCPVQKVISSGEGCALMQNPAAAGKIISACVKATDKPITVKFRKGFDENNINAAEFAKMCEGAGASLITIHGRLGTEFYSGKSDRKVIENAVKSVKIPVMANGDIFSKQDAYSILNETGAAGIMVARGTLGNPQIFSDILGIDYPLSRYEAVKMHFETLYRFMGEKFTVLNMRKHLLWYLKYTKGGKAFNARAGKCGSIAELYELSKEAFYES